VYGPRQRPDLAIHKFASRIAAGQEIEVFGDGSTARDYSYVADIVDGIMACARQAFGFEVFNLGGSQPVTLSRLIELLEKSMKKPARIKRLPNQPGDVPCTWADTAKSASRLGYSPRVAIEEGIPLFLEWFDNQKKSAKNGRQ
jgi:UDP-glucuronate 4-epimerase